VSQDWAAGAVGNVKSNETQQSGLPVSEMNWETHAGPRLSTTSPLDKEMLACPPPNATVLVDGYFGMRPMSLVE
jgi:hypothetical protein